ncbi:AAA family ATPase, partial [Thauera sp.]|uniref:AAA family ATPase n=1 Tax=Thauera sp. TaxID=1905334 RepID=UPI00338E1596
MKEHEPSPAPSSRFQRFHRISGDAVMVRGCFITGTDTEIGKTTIAAAIVSLLGKTGLRVAGLKPVAAGMSAIDGER